MTAQDAIRWVDEKKHNVYSLEDKLAWLDQAERMAAQLHRRHGIAGAEAPVTPETELRIPEPYAALYLRWLEAQMDYAAQEYLLYNNAIAMFHSLWAEYANLVCRESTAAPSRFRYL